MRFKGLGSEHRGESSHLAGCVRVVKLIGFHALIGFQIWYLKPTLTGNRDIWNIEVNFLTWKGSSTLINKNRKVGRDIPSSWLLASEQLTGDSQGVHLRGSPQPLFLCLTNRTKLPAYSVLTGGRLLPSPKGES